MILRQAIGHIIREHREASGRTLRSVAKDSGVALGYLSEVERGIKDPSSEVVHCIAKALGVPVPAMLRQASELMEFREVTAQAVLAREPVVQLPVT